MSSHNPGKTSSPNLEHIILSIAEPSVHDNHHNSSPPFSIGQDARPIRERETESDALHCQEKEGRGDGSGGLSDLHTAWHVECWQWRKAKMTGLGSRVWASKNHDLSHGIETVFVQRLVEDSN